MELLQKVDVKTPLSLDKSQGNMRVSGDENIDDSANNPSFDEQLNKQLNQTKDNTKAIKTEVNQQDEAPVGDTSEAPAALDALADQADVRVDIKLSDTRLLTPENTSQQADLLTPGSDTLLPQAGSGLPLTSEISPVNQLLDNQNTPLNSTITVQTPVKNATQNSLENIQTARQQQSDVINKTSAVLTEQNIKQELTPPKIVNAPLNLNANVSEKMNVQDARYAKIMSETPTADVIAQTTRLQQVPLTTAVSETLSSAKNSVPVFSVESAGILNNATPANNTGQINSTFNSVITTPVQNPNWSQQMTQQVSYMIKGGFQQAEIKLNPAHLGPMEIKLAINDDQASVNFVTQHAPVRDVIDSAIPRLKEMLEQQGLNLSDANVSTQSEQQQADTSAESEDGGELSERFVEESHESKVSKNEEIINVSSGVSLFA